MSRQAPAIFWDMDGTLLDSEPIHEFALVEALRSQGIVAPPDFHEFVIGKDARAVHGFCAERLGLALGLQEWLGLKYRVYFASLDRLKPREDAVERFLDYRARGIRQGVVSNSDRMVVMGNLDAAGLTTPGLLTVSRNDVRQGKPHPEPYLRAAWLLDLDPASCFAVEDSTTGAASGVAAGMTTLFWPQVELPTPDGARRIHSLAELDALLGGAAAR